MSPLFQGATCEPQDAVYGNNCTLGGFPEYSLNISSVAQIQLAINFARNLNLRLVVRNTGHDFLGKNTGEGALSVWTHHLRNIEVIHNYVSAGGRYQGPAFKLGAGVMVYELYEAAEREGYTAVAGECRVRCYSQCTSHYFPEANESSLDGRCHWWISCWGWPFPRNLRTWSWIRPGTQR